MAKHSKYPEPTWNDSAAYQRNVPVGDANGGNWGYPSMQDSAQRYSRDSYGTGRASGRRKRGSATRGGGVGKKILIVVLALLAILIAGTAAYVAIFNGKLHDNLSTPDEMSQVLTPAEAGQPYYILLLGSDWRENSGTSDKPEMSGDQQRADVIILARMDPANKLVTMVSVPRDTRWYHDGTVSKINEAYNIGGAALQTQVISELTGVPIAHTVETHFSGMEGLIDAVGGVWVDVPQAIEYKDALTGENVRVEEGRQLLNGQAAQIFARVRKAYTDGDVTRQSNVRVLVSAIVDSILDKPFFEYPALGLKIADCFGTDMGLFDLVGLARDFGSGYKMYSGTGPTAGDFEEEYDGLWLCYDNPDGWKRVMDAVDAGEDPSEIDPNTETETQAAIDSGEYYDYGEYYEDYGYYGYYE